MTAKLSRLFYDRLGEQIANELVDWFNAVDTTYRAELRDLNELNYARFEAKFEQRLAEQTALLRVEFQTGLHGLRTELKSEIQSLKAELIKWMFLFWAGTALAGLLLR